jgi:hypothetical protein
VRGLCGRRSSPRFSVILFSSRVTLERLAPKYKRLALYAPPRPYALSPLPRVGCLRCRCCHSCRLRYLRHRYHRRCRYALPLHTASAVVVAAVSAPTAVVAAAPLVCQSPSTPLPLPPPRAPSPNKSRATGTCHHASFLTCTGYRLTLTGKLDSLKDFPGRNRRTRATAWDARRPRTQTSPRPATAHRRSAQARPL